MHNPKVLALHLLALVVIAPKTGGILVPLFGPSIIYLLIASVLLRVMVTIIGLFSHYAPIMDVHKGLFLQK